MSEIIRFDPVGTIEGFEESEFGQYCFASDLDAQLLRADTAEAALKIAAEDVALMPKDLDAAEQRIAERCELLGKILGAINGEPLNFNLIMKMRPEIRAALNPNPEAESHEPQCLLCLDKKTVPGNISGGFVKDCPDCCGEEG